MKRIRLTKSGKVRHNRAFGKHLRSHKSGKRLRRLRQDKFMSNPEAKRLEKLLFRRLRGRDQSADDPSQPFSRAASCDEGRACRAGRGAGGGGAVLNFARRSAFDLNLSL